jgi:hypothetical protein
MLKEKTRKQKNMKNFVHIMKEKTEYSEQKQKFREKRKDNRFPTRIPIHTRHKKHQNIQKTKKMHKTEILAGKNVHKLFI